MLTSVIPKLPMRVKAQTKKYYIEELDFMELADNGDYLMLKKDDIEIHFFEFKTLDPLQNDGQIYIRTDNIDLLYTQLLERNVVIHPIAPLKKMPWGQKEFSLLDPDHNCITFGQALE